MKKLLITLVLGVATHNINAQTIVGTPPDDDEVLRIFTKVEKEATFPGGLGAWRTFLEKNLRAELAADYIPLKRKQKLAQQTVSVQFIVSKEGKISDVKALHNPENPVHPMLAMEAVRVIKIGPDWIPAEQNNKKVTYQAIQNITFQVAR